MSRNKKILENITVEDFAAEARCVARVDGQVIFVDQVAPGDVVDLQVIRKKKSFLEAIPIHFHSFSRYRQDPFCDHFGTCGGCRWQHIGYDKQLEFKFQQVKDQFERIGHLKDFSLFPVLASEKQQHYRNKLEYTFSNMRWLTADEIRSGLEFDRDGLGFHKPGAFDKVLDIERCYLQDDLSNKIRLSVKKYAKDKHISFYDLRKNEGLLRNLIVRNSSQGEWMVILQVKYDDQSAIHGILNHLEELFPEIASLYYIINPKNNESYQDLEAIYFAGERYIIERMNHLQFRIGPKSFFQTNSLQAYQLYSLIKTFASIQPDEVVYDLYTGTGSISLFVADHARKVVGLEYIEEAVHDARENASINGIDNVSFYSGDIRDVMNEDLVRKEGRPHVVITDPPRAGMHGDVIHRLLEIRPGRIVYVSCNPATQARDIERLQELYRLEKAQPVDMFPHTHHIENVALLKLHKV